jgi:hypothetical protein
MVLVGSSDSAEADQRMNEIMAKYGMEMLAPPS